MTAVLNFALIAAFIWLAAYFRIPLIWWSVMLALGLTSATLLQAPTPIMIVDWLLFSILVLPLNFSFLRQRLVSNKVFRLFQKAMPVMSQTEKEALAAGTVWWDKELFSGYPDWQKLFALPAPKLTKEEQAFIDGPVEELCHMLNDWEITEELHDLPPAVWKYMKEQRFFGMIIPKKFGGLEMSALAHSSVVMKIASRSVTAAVTVMVPNSLGPAELLLHYGTEEQKNYYLPRLARGEEVPCFALTGPEAGSDASSIPDVGIICKGIFKGKEIIGIKLNWDKRYITLGPVATLLGLAFKLYDPEHLLGNKQDLGISCALIPTTTPGIDIGNRHFPLNIPFQNGPNRGKDVFIPLDWLIGGPEYAGQGWRMLMECLAAGRSISLPALSTGAGKLVCRATGAYARIRKQFKTPIGRFEGVEEPLARMAGLTYMMDAARKLTAQAVDSGEKPSVVSAIVKYQLTENMRKVVNDAMDVQGGTGICMGERNLIGRVYQAIPISITVEGANILTRSLIIFGQGAIRCHPYLYKEMQAVLNRDADERARDFDMAFFGHIGFIISNAARTLFLSLTGGRLAKAPLPGIAGHYCRQVTRLSASFALVADCAMLLLGGSLKRREKLSGRFADVLGQLYMISALVKQFNDRDLPSAEVPLLRWSCQQSLYTAQEQLLAIFDNFPNRYLGWLLRRIVFPWGRSYLAPDDHSGQLAAQLLLQPSATRNSLTEGIYLPVLKEALARLDQTLEKVIAAERIEQKIKSAVTSGELEKTTMDTLLLRAVEKAVITINEAATVQAAELARKEVIKVDDFAPEYWSKGTFDVAHSKEKLVHG